MSKTKRNRNSSFITTLAYKKTFVSTNGVRFYIPFKVASVRAQSALKRFLLSALEPLVIVERLHVLVSLWAVGALEVFPI